MVGYTQISFTVILSFLFLCLCRRSRNSLFTNWPIFGMLPSILYNLPHVHDHVTQVLKQHGGTGEFKGPWFTNMNFVVTSDPMNVNHILSKNFNNYIKGPEFHEIFEPFGGGIFSSDGEKWKNNRRIIQELLKDRGFQFFHEKIVLKKIQSCLLPFLDRVNEKRMEFDLQDVFHRLSFDNICLKVTGVDPHCLSFQNAFDQIGNAILYRILVPRSVWKLQKWLRIGQEKRMVEACKIFDEFLYQCISSKREELKRCRENDVAESELDLLTAFIKNEEKNGQVDDKFLRDFAINLFAAGRDTITVGLTWFFWLVATHPFVEAKIVKEIKEIFSFKEEDDRKVLASREIRKLVYLHAALREALRLFPPTPFERKSSIKFDTLPSGHCIKPNEIIIFSLYAMGRSKEIWGADYMEFRPERWISEKGRIVQVPSYKFITFNAGPRSCLGKDLSLIEMKMVASFILWNYHIEVVEGHPVSPSISIGFFMKHGLKVRITKRDI